MGICIYVFIDMIVGDHYGVELDEEIRNIISKANRGS